MTQAPSTLFEGRPIVVIGSFAAYDYAALWQRQQRIVRRLSETNRVYYLERLGARRLSAAALSRAVLKRLGPRGEGSGPQAEGVTFVRGGVVPFHGVAAADNMTARLCEGALRAAAGELDEAVCVCFYPAPYSLRLLERVDFRFVAYDAAQNFAALPEVYGDNAGEIDRRIAQLADFNSVDSCFMEHLRGRQGVDCVRVPQGVDADWPKQAQRRKSPVARALRELSEVGPVVGFVGGAGVAFDGGAFAELAALMPDVTFVLVGPVEDGVLPEWGSNVRLMGSVPSDEVAEAMSALDVGLIPYVLNEHTKAVLPTKLAEYVAAGVRVVSTALPEVRAMLDSFEDGQVLIAGDAPSMERAVRTQIAAGRLDAAALTEVAENHSWEHLLSDWTQRADEAFRNER